jgi:hypothetical protein
VLGLDHERLTFHTAGRDFPNGAECVAARRT